MNGFLITIETLLKLYILMEKIFAGFYQFKLDSQQHFSFVLLWWINEDQQKFTKTPLKPLC